MYLPNLAFCWRLTYQPLSCTLGCILLFNISILTMLITCWHGRQCYLYRVYDYHWHFGLWTYIYHKQKSDVNLFSSQIGIKTNSEINSLLTKWVYLIRTAVSCIYYNLTKTCKRNTILKKASFKENRFVLRCFLFNI